MKNVITDRLDMFLAKIAGYDVDIKTMTPPTASNIREKLLLDIAKKYNKSDDTPSGGGVFDMNVVMSTDPETGKDVITTDKTAAELFDAINAGKMARVSTTVTYPSGEGTITVETTYCCSIFAKKMVADGDTFFGFGFTDVDSDDGVLGFVSAELSADDTVVLTQV